MRNFRRREWEMTMVSSLRTEGAVVIVNRIIIS